MTKMKKQPNINEPFFTPRSREDAVNFLGKIRAEVIEMRKLQLEREAKIKQIDDEYLERIDLFQQRIDYATDVLRVWAEDHPDEFGPLKSIECVHGKFGFRITPPAVRPIRPLTWAKVLENLERFESFNRFIRIKNEVDREAILAAREELTADQLKAIGVRISQDEVFFVDPKIEDEP
jgi:phage host-nuclease inhibitor protein Gam